MGYLRVNTIYPAYMGECNKYGIGVPCTFIRLNGCNLRCYLKKKGTPCDTPEALSCEAGKHMEVSSIIKSVRNIGNKVICLTGGEPLLQDCTELLTELVNNGFKVVVETNGTRSIAPYRHIKNVSFVVDCKAPSTGYYKDMAAHEDETFFLLDKDDFIKFVIDDEEDLDVCRRFIEASEEVFDCNFAVGLFWGSKISYKTLMNIMPKGNRIYLNMQAHKMQCMYDRFKGNWDFYKIVVPREL